MRIKALDREVLNPGVRSFGPMPLPANLSRIAIELSRDNWPDIGGNVFEVESDLSFDGGATWPSENHSGFAAGGGNPLSVSGEPTAYSRIEIILPQAGNSQRRWKGKITVSAVLQTEITVELN